MPVGVIFDLYETLITEYDPGWTPPSPSIAQRLGISEDAMTTGWRRVRDARMRGVIDYPDALQAICRFANAQAPSPTLVNQLAEERASYKAKPFQRLDPRILRLCAALKDDLDARLCVMSNASEEET